MMVDDKLELATIDVLPDDVLLRVFSFHQPVSGKRDPSPFVRWKWHTLTHVCRRWRRVIFTSPRHLGLRLVAADKFNPMADPETTLDSWSAASTFELPLSIWYSCMKYPLSAQQEDDVVAMLEYPDRIHDIGLIMSSSLLARSTAWAESSFPALEHIRLQSPDIDLGLRDFVHLPSKFLCGSSGNNAPPRLLRYIELKNISFPSLSQLLLSSVHLVSLSLGKDCIAGVGFLSPEALAASLSATTRLESLFICPDSKSYPEQNSEHPPPSGPLVLNSLIDFGFIGSGKYLEDFVSRIDAPHLESLDVSLSQGVDDITQLSQFISGSEQLRALPHGLTIESDPNNSSLRHHFSWAPDTPNTAPLKLCHRGMPSEGWWVSQVHHIWGQLSPLVFSVERLRIITHFSPRVLLTSGGRQDKLAMLWLRLLRPFNRVQTLEVHGTLGPGHEIPDALEQSTRETAGEVEVLPALRILAFHGCYMTARASNSIRSFITARKLSGRPFTMLRT